MKILRSFFISSVAISIFSSVSTAQPFSLLNSQAAESSTKPVVIDSTSKPLSDSSANLSLKNSPRNLAQSIFLPAGVYKLRSRPPVYYFNGLGHYCWFQSPADYKRLAGSTPPKILTYNYHITLSVYDGICTGGRSKPAAHPDPDLFL